MKKVLIYKSSLLGYSETFIKEQVSVLGSWHGVLVGLKRSKNGLDLSDLDVRLLGDLKKGAWQRLKWSLARHLYLPWPGVSDRLSAEGAQLLHIHFGTEAVRFWPVANALKLPVLITLHGFDINTHREWWESGRGGHWMRSYPRRLLQVADSDRVRFVAVSNAIRERAIEFGIPAEKVLVRHIGINISKFKPSDVPVDRRRPRILFAGRLVENKGVAHLIRAFIDVKKSIPHAELVIVGDGPLRSTLIQMAKESKIAVTFLGSVSPNQLRNEISAARVFCLPSVTIANGNSEGFGMVLLEAQACGVPVVTSSRGGRTEGIAHGGSGYAFPEGDEASLSSHLIELLTDDEKARAFGTVGRYHVERQFDIRDCTRQLEETYDSMVELN